MASLSHKSVRALLEDTMTLIKLIYDTICMERPFCRCLLIQVEKDQVENLVM